MGNKPTYLTFHPDPLEEIIEKTDMALLTGAHTPTHEINQDVYVLIGMIKTLAEELKALKTKMENPCDE